MDMTTILKELLKEFPIEELNKLSLADFTDLAKGLVVEAKAPVKVLKTFMIKTEKVIELKKEAPWSKVIKMSEYSIMEYPVSLQDSHWAENTAPVMFNGIEITTHCRHKKNGKGYILCALYDSGCRVASKYISLDGEILNSKDVEPWIIKDNKPRPAYITLGLENIKEIHVLNGCPVNEKSQETVDMDTACDKLAAVLF